MPFRSPPPRAALAVLSLIAYVISWRAVGLLIVHLYDWAGSSRDYTLMRALIYSLMVWMSGAAAAALTIDISEQVQSWSLSIGFAALHALVFLLLLQALISPTHEIGRIAVGLAAVGGLAAAISYSVFLAAVAAIWVRRSGSLVEKRAQRVADREV